MLREKTNDGTTKILSGSIPVRWGLTGSWTAVERTNIVVEFKDGRLPRMGDMIISTNGFAPGDVSRVVKVYKTGKVDVELESFAIRLQEPTQWSYVGDPGRPFQNGWYNLGSDFQTARLTVVEKEVYIQGIVTHDTDPSGVIFELPILARPPKALMVSAITSNMVGGVNQLVRVEITPDGLVRIPPSGLPGGTDVSLCQIIYRVD